MDLGSVSEADYPLNRAEPRVTILVSGKALRRRRTRRSGSYVEEPTTKQRGQALKAEAEGPVAQLARAHD